MDILSFVFGILFVVVIVIIIGTIYNFVKVRGLLKDTEEIHRRIDIDLVNLERSLVSYVDSKVDKLASKIK